MGKDAVFGGDESKAARLARLAVGSDVDARDLAEGREEVLVLFFERAKRKEEKERRR